MADFRDFEPREAGKFLSELVSGHPTIAPRGQFNYHNATYRTAINQLLEDIAKKARKSKETML